MTGKDLGFIKWIHEKCLENSNRRNYLYKALDDDRTVTISIGRGGIAEWELSKKEITALIDYYEDQRIFYKEGFKDTELAVSEHLKAYYEEFEGGYVEIDE